MLSFVGELTNSCLVVSVMAATLISLGAGICLIIVSYIDRKGDRDGD